MGGRPPLARWPAARSAWSVLPHPPPRHTPLRSLAAMVSFASVPTTTNPSPAAPPQLRGVHDPVSDCEGVLVRHRDGARECLEAHCLGTDLPHGPVDVPCVDVFDGECPRCDWSA